MVRLLCCERQMFAQRERGCRCGDRPEDASIVKGGLRLHVPRVNVGGPAAQKEQNRGSGRTGPHRAAVHGRRCSRSGPQSRGHQKCSTIHITHESAHKTIPRDNRPSFILPWNGLSVSTQWLNPGPRQEQFRSDLAGRPDDSSPAVRTARRKRTQCGSRVDESEPWLLTTIAESTGTL